MGELREQQGSAVPSNWGRRRPIAGGMQHTLIPECSNAIATTSLLRSPACKPKNANYEESPESTAADLAGQLGQRERKKPKGIKYAKEAVGQARKKKFFTCQFHEERQLSHTRRGTSHPSNINTW